MNKKFDYKMVIFDVDGTILDTSKGLLAAVQYTISHNNLKKLTEEELLTFIGPPVQDSFRKYYHTSDTETQQLADVFRERYKSVDLLKAEPYDRIYELFDLLLSEGIVIGIATYKREDYALQLLKHFEFDRYTDIIYGGDNFNQLKKKDIIAKCLARVHNITPEDVVVIGDSKSDGVGAIENGCDFCGVTYGFGIKEEKDLESVHTAKIADSVGQLIDWIKNA